MPSELEAVREALKTKDPANELIFFPPAYYYLALDELNQRTSKVLGVVDTRMTSEGCAGDKSHLAIRYPQ